MWHLVRFVCVSVCLPACLLVMSISRTPFGFWNSGAEGTLDVEAESPRMEALFGESNQWRNYNFCPPPANIRYGP